jgi:uncharacterized Zn finger protein
MSEIKTFFRSCPACGRRFQIKLLSKKAVGGEVIKENLSAAESASRSALIPASSYAMPLALGEGEPIIVDVEEFKYTYRCKHCGHVWSEMHDEEYAKTVNE